MGEAQQQIAGDCGKGLKFTGGGVAYSPAEVLVLPCRPPLIVEAVQLHRRE